MAILGFHSLAEFTTYVTFVFLGLAIMMVVGCITSAGDFVSHYYMYATGDPYAVPEKASFWKNAVTFFYVATYATQCICEPITLTPFVRRIPIYPRIIIALIIPLVELVILLVVPAAKVKTQESAIAVLMCVGAIGGISKALIDTSMNAMVGPFPTKFMNGAIWGLTVASLITSLLQCIIKGSMERHMELRSVEEQFDITLTGSRIYFGVALFIDFCALCLMIALPWNPYARKYIAEFRSRFKKNDDIPDEILDGETELEITEGKEVSAGNNEPTAVVDLDMSLYERQKSSEDPKDLAEKMDEDQLVESEMNENEREAAATKNVLTASGDADHMQDTDQTGEITSSEQMLQANLWTVIRKIYPMLFCCFFVFFSSLLIWPGVFIGVNTTDGWYITLVVLMFNIGDFVARCCLMFKRLRPSALAVLIGAIVRVIVIVPLLVICVRGIVPGVALPYVLSFFHGLTNGYFGAMAMIHGPRTPSLTTAGERSIAAICSGVFTLIGLAGGSNFALLVNLRMPK